jgi:hypothetical protein
MNRENIKCQIQELLDDHILNIEKLRKLYHDLTLFNARLILDEKEDNVLRNVENFMSHAITLYDRGYIDGWVLQLEAASAIIPTS